MAITIVTNDDPSPLVAGKLSSDATIVYSGFTSGTVEYAIRDDVTGEILTSNVDHTWTVVDRLPQAVYVGVDRIEFILPFRHSYSVRVRQNSGVWSGWVSFYTRDKNYGYPNSNFPNRNTVTATAQGATVTNPGSTTVIETVTAHGSTVTNNKEIYAGTTSVTNTAHGATVVGPS